MRINFTYENHEDIFNQVREMLGLEEFQSDFFAWVQCINGTTIPVVVIEVDHQPTFVFMGNRFAYKIQNPTEKFFKDFESWSLVDPLAFTAYPSLYEEESKKVS